MLSAAHSQKNARQSAVEHAVLEESAIFSEGSAGMPTSDRLACARNGVANWTDLERPKHFDSRTSFVVSTQKNGTDNVSIKENRTPLGLKIAIVLTGVMAWRISALAYLPMVGDSIPEYWGIAFKGDAFIGLTALIVAFLLFRFRTPSVWALGIAWQVAGLADLYVAIEVQLIHSLGNAPFFVIPAGMVMHGLALYLIWVNRACFLTSQARQN